MADTPLDPKAREALNAYAARTSPPDAARLDAIWQSVDAPRRSWRWVWLPVVAAAAAAVVVFARPSPVPPAPVVETVRLDRGRLEVRPRAGATRTVVTPQATFVVQQAAAWLEVTPAGTVLSVESGEVVWRTRTRSGTVRAGEQATIGEDSAPVVPPVPRPTPGLSAETALYEEAMRAHDAGKKDEALRLFRDHRARFPDGIFAPEVSIGLMLELQSAGQTRAAADEARAFSARFAADPRAESIRHWGERLE